MPPPPGPHPGPEVEEWPFYSGYRPPDCVVCCAPCEEPPDDAIGSVAHVAYNYEYLSLPTLPLTFDYTGGDFTAISILVDTDWTITISGTWGSVPGFIESRSVGLFNVYELAPLSDGLGGRVTYSLSGHALTPAPDDCNFNLGIRGTASTGANGNLDRTLVSIGADHTPVTPLAFAGRNLPLRQVMIVFSATDLLVGARYLVTITGSLMSSATTFTAAAETMEGEPVPWYGTYEGFTMVRLPLCPP